VRAAARTEPVYREAPPAELPGLASLVGRVLEEELGHPTGGFEKNELAVAGERYDPARDLFLLAELDGRPAGVLLATHDEASRGNAATIRIWVVDARSRGRGVGRELLLRAVAAFRERAVATVKARCLALSPAALRLFWMHGFRVSGLGSVEIGGRVRETISFEKRGGGMVDPC
jgi:GNAT superfamily N-acetyltransferase